MAAKRNILVIENNDYHFQLLRQALSEASLQYGISRTPSALGATQILKKRQFALIITENLEKESSDQWLPNLLRLATQTPIIVLTSQSNEKKAVEAMKSGAHDYLIKNRDSLLNIEKIVSAAAGKNPPRKRITSKKKQHSHVLMERFKQLTDLINNPSRPLKTGRRHLKNLEKEVDNMVQMIKSLIPS